MMPKAASKIPIHIREPLSLNVSPEHLREKLQNIIKPSIDRKTSNRSRHPRNCADLEGLGGARRLYQGRLDLWFWVSFRIGLDS
jgi:hypothetical protein